MEKTLFEICKQHMEKGVPDLRSVEIVMEAVAVRIQELNFLFRCGMATQAEIDFFNAYITFGNEKMGDYNDTSSKWHY